MTCKTWLVRQGGRTIGRYDAGAIREMVLNSQISGRDTVSEKGTSWEPLSQVPELIPTDAIPVLIFIDGAEIKYV